MILNGGMESSFLVGELIGFGVDGLSFRSHAHARKRERGT
jgi:hypothetical protein